MMPHYQPHPYMEPPGFVVPTTHLHLMDYRRMLNPQYYHTMAYHSRRFRYQQNGQTRETTSSEVQTEPLSAAQRTSTPGGPGAAKATGGLPVRGPGVSIERTLSPAASAKKGVPPPPPPVEPKDAAPSSATRTPASGGGFVIQTEEVRIECCATPAGLQLLHETAEVTRGFSQRSGSVLQGRVVRRDDGRRLAAEPEVKARPDVPSVGTHGAEEESRNQTEPAVIVAVPDVGEPGPSEDLHFKVVHLPFDSEYLDELWKMESTVWSAKETATPSPGSPEQNGRPESRDATPADTTEDAEETVIQMPPLAEEDQEDPVPAEEEMPDDDERSFMDVPVAEEPPLTPAADDDDGPLKADGIVQDQRDTSFESLPAYLPSSGWLADFDDVYRRGGTITPPPPPRKRNRPASSSSRGLELPARRRKLDLDHDENRPAGRKPKERFKLRGKADHRSLSDHERRLDENERLCSRCVATGSIRSPAAAPGLDGRAWKRKESLLRQWSDALLPTCDACKSSGKRRLAAARNGSNPPDVRRRDSEGESSENASRRADGDRPGGPKRNVGVPLACRQNVETHPRLREKNCACKEPPPPLHCPHGNAIRRADENRAATPLLPQDKRRMVDQIYLTRWWQTGELGLFLLHFITIISFNIWFSTLRL